MSSVVRPYWLAVILGVTSLVQAQSHHARILTVGHGGGGQGHSGSMHGSPGGFVGSSPGGFVGNGIPAHANGHNSLYAVGGYGGYGYGYGYGYSYPLLMNTGGGVPLLWPVLVPQGFGATGGGLMLPMPPPHMAQNQPANPAPAARRRNTNRSKELVEIGDRSFRGGNIKRAEDKYILAAKADPTSSVPHVHMAQVSLARGDYVAAADHLRDAVTVSAEAGWLLTAPDIQAIFGEPADFARHLARLESHLQANPNDRDAWFVLGAECYLSGRTKQAADVFERLTDRKPDEALAAFMDASKTKLPAATN
jgi:tetratricopeptide (TPR) repeat protein